MKNVLKKGLSLILAITIIFSSAIVGISEVDFDKDFTVEANAADSSNTLTINWNNIKSTGHQSVSGPCGCYALAYCRDILDGKSYNWTAFSYEGYVEAWGRYGYTVSWAKGNYAASAKSTVKLTLKAVYDQINNGRPAILHVKGGRSTGQHWVAVVGYQNVTDVNNLSYNNFLIIDSVSSKYEIENLGSLGYTLKETSGTGYRYAYTSSGSVPLSNNSTNKATYNFTFNANGGTLGSSGAFSVSYGDQFEILNTTCTRSGYTWAGWNVKRNNDNKWYVSGQGWCTESQISSNGYTKKTYSNYETATLNDSWTSGISGDCSYTFYAKWIQSRQTRIRIFMSPYGRGYDHITAINNSTNSGFAQEYIYAWYILYDANTGELLNTYSNDNYSVELAIYDPNGGLVYNKNYTGSNDANWIGISPQMSGTYTATAKLTGDLTASVTTTYEVSYDAELLSSPESVSLNLNGTNSATIAVTPSGAYPGDKNATVYYNSSSLSVSSRWSNGQLYITLSGLKVADTSIRVDLYENYTGNKNVVAQLTIPVTVIGTSYIISYNANGGSGAPASQTKHYGTDLTLSTITPIGKSYTVNFNGNGGMVSTSSKTYTQTFSNWNTYQSGEGTSYAPGSIFSSNVDVTMYAQWTNPRLDNITEPTRSGYYFMGWYDSSSLDDNGLPVGKRYMSNSSITRNVTLYAMWSKSPTIMYGDSDLNGVIEPIDITRFNSYRINGTTDDEILFRGDVDADGDLDFTDITYINNVRIGEISYTSLPAYQKFDGFYITGYPKRTYEYGETFDSTGLSCYVCYTNGTCYIFNNNLSVSGYDPYKIGTQTVTVNYYQYSTTFTVTVKAPQYTIYYDANGGSVSSTGKTVTYGNSIGTLPTPTKEGYTFLGWSFSNSGTNYVTSSTTYSYMSNKTLYALWKSNSIILNANSTNDAVISSAGEMKYYTFTPTTTGLYVIYSTGTADSKVYLYNGNGTELANDDDSGDNTNFRLEYNLTAGAQYTFGVKYYNTSLTGTIPFTFRRVYTLTYDANGGTGAPSSQKKEHGAGIFISSTEPTKNGYTFMGWSTNNSATLATYQPGSGFSNNADTTLYAVWKLNPTVLNVNSTNSATISNSGEMKYFTYTPDATGTYVIYSTGSVDSKVYLYDANGTQITYDDDGAGDRNFRLEYDLTANTEYTFGVCCYSSLTGTIPFTFGRVYTITYNANGGTGAPSSQKKDYGKTLTLSSTEPTRNGYEFLGWATSSTATSASYQPEDDFTNNDDITLFAVWEENVVLSSISVYSNPNKLGYYLGDSFDSTGLKIKLTYSDGSTEIITSGFTLSYSNFKTTPGTKTITVSYKGQKTTFNVTVVTPYITLSSSSKSLIIGDTSTITATTTPFAQPVTWTSSNTSVATVANGVITANAEGTAVITAEFTYNGITYSETCDVTVSKPVHTHIASDWITDQNATCTTDGRKHKECTTCGETLETATISATGHTSSDWIIDRNATCTTNGSKHKECTTCGEILVTTVIVSTGHISSDWIVDRNATCTASGSKHKECTTCGGILETTVIASTGHSSSDWIVDRNATCTASGAKHKVCSVCGITTEISTIPATGHIYVWKNDYENLKKIGTCSVCGDVSIDAIPIVNVFTFVPNSDGSGYTLTDCISEYSGKVTVPKEYNGLPVTAIGTDAFRDCTGITSVVIPDTVTSIGGSAFRGCTNLTEIVLSANITSIPGAMCYGCTKLETVVIPEGVVNIGGYAFSSCTKLKTVVIPDGATNIGGNVFTNCKSLIINCNEGSTAKAYADANGISYIFNNVNTKMDLVTGIIHTDILGGDLSSIMSGSDTLTYSINTSCAGTGAVVNVMKNGMLHSQYTLVINGDTNGDSVCDVLDCFEVERAANGNGDLIGVYVMAADSNADDVVDITDYQAIVNRVMES